MDKSLLYCSTENYFCQTEAEALEKLKVFLTRNAGRIVDSVVPPLYQDSDPARLNQKLVAACATWTGGSKGLGLVGKTGTGKTRAMYAMLRHLIEHPKVERDTRRKDDFRFYCQIPWVETINDASLAKTVLASCSFDDATGAAERLRGLHACDVLFIDDLGQSKISDRVGVELYELVEHRTSHMKPILFTSNFRGKQLAAMFNDTTRGDAVVRRLSEFCAITVIEGSA